jgi:uncharacterized protein (TIGR00725 family)
MATCERRRRIAVIGAADAAETERLLARQVGAEIARRGAILLCGGLGGVMHAAAMGAREQGGLTLGFLPGYEASAANEAIAVPLPTGLGQARNVLVVASAEAVIAIGGSAGTLSEIGMALKLGRPVVALHTWSLTAPHGERPAIRVAREGVEAVRLALAAAEEAS